VNLTLGMFVETSWPVRQREEAMKSLLSTLTGLEREFQTLTAKVSTELSDSPKVLMSKGEPD
jgi:hypothetical protein